MKISETGDSGEEVTSTISVPSSPSLPLITCLLDMSTHVHAQHPTSLPVTTLMTANTMCLNALAESYQSLSEQTLTQNFALQLLFDVNFIQTLLVSRENKVGNNNFKFKFRCPILKNCFQSGYIVVDMLI